MAALWFYRPHGLIGKAISSVIGGEWVHVGIQHAVADVAVLTEAHPVRGVYCIPLSRATDPDKAIHFDVPDAWTSRWLIDRWGVRYSWLDAVAFASPLAVHSSLSRRQVICSGLVVEFVRGANAAGYKGITLDLPDDRPADRVSPTELFNAIRVPGSTT